MLTLIGILVTFGAILGGYLWEKGNPWVLVQPAELLIIGGAALEVILVSNTPQVIRKMLTGVSETFRPSKHTPQTYLLYLRMLYEIFTLARRSGWVALEGDVEDPGTSRIFANYPHLLKDRVTLNFVSDTLRMMVLNASSAHDLDHLMDIDIDIQHHGRHQPVRALHSIADALPGLGIVAAVLGIVICMQSIAGAPDQVGEKVASALVGTFLGILLCYGVMGPLATRLEGQTTEHIQLLHTLRTGMVASAQGLSPILAVEAARRSIPVELRPSFNAMEVVLRREARVPTTENSDGAKSYERTAA